MPGFYTTTVTLKQGVGVVVNLEKFPHLEKHRMDGIHIISTHHPSQPRDNKM